MSSANGRIPMILIHGAWLSARSWENFADYFGKRGFDVRIPQWPRKHGDVEDLRESADELAGLGLDELVGHYEDEVRALDRPPVLMGHSYGGLIAELRSASPALAHPSKRQGIVTLTPEEFTYSFVNMLSPEDPAAAYERYAVPETGQIFYEAGFANFHLHAPTEVHFKRADRAPLLIVGAENDHTVPASLSKAQFKRYERSPAKTDYLELEGRPHLFMVGEGWEEAAAAIDGWLAGVLDAPKAEAG